jgi:hypothetical protein
VNVPTGGIPKGPDGKPNLSAPAPRCVVATSRPAAALRIKDAGTLAREGGRTSQCSARILSRTCTESVYISGIKLDRDTLRTRFKKAAAPADERL